MWYKEEEKWRPNELSTTFKKTTYSYLWRAFAKVTNVNLTVHYRITITSRHAKTMMVNLLMVKKEYIFKTELDY